jgi:hypothetical protein
MMATTATHKLGDISREMPDLCVIHSEDAENYIGSWVIGVELFNVAFPKNTTRELTDQEKEKYRGMRIAIGDTPAYKVCTTQHAETKESPIIVLPADETRKQQLRDKLVEYRERMHPYRAPELQMSTICKIAVLERLLRDGQVNTLELHFEMVETYKLSFDIHAFQNACGVIADYCAAAIMMPPKCSQSQ